MTDWLPIIGILIAVIVAFKLLKGAIKVGVIVLLIGVAVLLFGMVG